MAANLQTVVRFRLWRQFFKREGYVITPKRHVILKKYHMPFFILLSQRKVGLIGINARFAITAQIGIYLKLIGG